jgi:hypothetical protein
MSEPENLVLKLLRGMRDDMSDMRGEMYGMRSEMATKHDVADVRSEVKSLRADVASDMMDMEKRLSDRITHLNRAVMEYHSSAVGHGLLFSDIDERLRKVEQHLKLSPTETH